MRHLSLYCAGLAVCVALSTQPATVAAADFSASLSGDQEVPPVETNAFGLALFSFQRVLGQERLISVRVAVGLSGPAIGAHVHNAAEGENGPIVLDFANGVVLSGFLNVNVNSAADLQGPFEGLSLTQFRQFMSEGLTYVNIHTQAHPGGEIRGQIEVD
jgi:hypothetical protein